MSRDLRCQYCNKLLARAYFVYIEVKCSRCKSLNQITTRGAIGHPTYTRDHTG
ncbi:Com family DNA-binding transcriptional regulator [Salmonella enterica]|uniref:Com family DNA-binding transcriptional regulator n=1 Tax=Salmonella enterica TaxID=28901 RepID=UPI00098E5E5A|nr:Com family DNA-binding transcriptional regulator [Salmonella enterica]